MKHHVSPVFMPDDKDAILARVHGRKSTAAAPKETVSKSKSFNAISPEIWAQLQASSLKR